MNAPHISRCTSIAPLLPAVVEDLIVPTANDISAQAAALTIEIGELQAGLARLRLWASLLLAIVAGFGMHPSWSAGGLVLLGLVLILFTALPNSLVPRSLVTHRLLARFKSLEELTPASVAQIATANTLGRDNPKIMGYLAAVERQGRAITAGEYDAIVASVD